MSASSRVLTDSEMDAMHAPAPSSRRILSDDAMDAMHTSVPASRRIISDAEMDAMADAPPQGSPQTAAMRPTPVTLAPNPTATLPPQPTSTQISPPPIPAGPQPVPVVDKPDKPPVVEPVAAPEIEDEAPGGIDHVEVELTKLRREASTRERREADDIASGRKVLTGTPDEIARQRKDAADRVYALDKMHATAIEKGSKGFGTVVMDRMTPDQIAKSLPFVGGAKELADAVDVYNAVQRVDKGAASARDLDVLLRFHTESQRDTTWGGSVANILVELPAFAGEIAATGGLYTAGRKAGSKATMAVVRKVIGNALKKKMAVKAAQVGGWVTGATFQSAATMPLRAAADTITRRTSNLELDEVGRLAIDEPDDSFLQSAAKAVGSSMIEVASERTGGTLGRVTGKVLGFIPGSAKAKAAKAAIAAKWMDKTGLKSTDLAKRIRSATAWDGVLQEVGEEEVGKAMRWAAQIDDNYKFTTPSELTAQIAAFSIPGAGANAIQYGESKLRDRGIVPDQAGETTPGQVGETAPGPDTAIDDASTFDAGAADARLAAEQPATLDPAIADAVSTAPQATQTPPVSDPAQTPASPEEAAAAALAAAGVPVATDPAAQAGTAPVADASAPVAAPAPTATPEAATDPTLARRLAVSQAAIDAVLSQKRRIPAGSVKAVDADKYGRGAIFQDEDGVFIVGANDTITEAWDKHRDKVIEAKAKAIEASAKKPAAITPAPLFENAQPSPDNATIAQETTAVQDTPEVAPVDAPQADAAVGGQVGEQLPPSPVVEESAPVAETAPAIAPATVQSVDTSPPQRTGSATPGTAPGSTPPQAGGGAVSNAAPPPATITGPDAQKGAEMPADAGVSPAPVGGGAGAAQVGKTTAATLRSQARPLLDIKSNATGWLAVDYADGTTLIHPTEDRVVRFVSSDERSGTALQRARSEAQAYAIDNPTTASTTTSPTGDLVVKPIYAPNAPQVQQPAASDTSAPESTTTAPPEIVQRVNRLNAKALAPRLKALAAERERVNLSAMTASDRRDALASIDAEQRLIQDRINPPSSATPGAVQSNEQDTSTPATPGATQDDRQRNTVQRTAGRDRTTQDAGDVGGVDRPGDREAVEARGVPSDAAGGAGGVQQGQDAVRGTAEEPAAGERGSAAPAPTTDRQVRAELPAGVGDAGGYEAQVSGVRGDGRVADVATGGQQVRGQVNVRSERDTPVTTESIRAAVPAATVTDLGDGAWRVELPGKRGYTVEMVARVSNPAGADSNSFIQNIANFAGREVVTASGRVIVIPSTPAEVRQLLRNAEAREAIVDRFQPDGSYSEKNRRVLLQRRVADMLTFREEAFHAAFDQALTEEERQTVIDATVDAKDREGETPQTVRMWAEERAFQARLELPADATNDTPAQAILRSIATGEIWDTSAKARRKSALTPAQRKAGAFMDSVARVRDIIVEWAKSSGYFDQAWEQTTENEGHDLIRNHNPFHFEGRVPAEVKHHFEGMPHVLTMFKANVPGARGQDAFESLGDEYFEIVERMAGGKAYDARRAVELAENFPEPEPRFHAWLLRQYEQTREGQSTRETPGGKRKTGKLRPKVMIDADALPVGSTFTIEGETLTVETDENGDKVIAHADDAYQTGGLPRIPIDFGSLKQTEEATGKAADLPAKPDDDVPFSVRDTGGLFQSGGYAGPIDRGEATPMAAKLGLTHADMLAASRYAPEGMRDPQASGFARGVKDYLSGSTPMKLDDAPSNGVHRAALEGFAAAEQGASEADREQRRFRMGQSGADNETGMLFSVRDTQADGWEAEVQRQMADARKTIVRDAQGRILAPNGKVSAYQNEDDAAMIRTPAFKRWFGDWEAASHRMFLDETPAVARLTGEEFKKSNTPITQQVAEWFASAHNGSAEHPILGRIELSERGVKDSLSHGLGREKAIAFAAVPDVIRRGRLVGYEKNWKGREYDGAMLVAPFEIAGKSYWGEVVVFRDPHTRRFYLHEVQAKEKLQSAFKTGAFPTSGREAGAAGAVKTIVQKLLEVKPDAISKSVNANGEPGKSEYAAFLKEAGGKADPDARHSIRDTKDPIVAARLAGERPAQAPATTTETAQQPSSGDTTPENPARNRGSVTVASVTTPNLPSTLAEWYANADAQEAEAQKQQQEHDDKTYGQMMRDGGAYGDTVSATKAAVAEERKAMNLPGLPSAQSRSWKAAMDAAVADNLPDRAVNLAQGILLKPRPLTDIEIAGMTAQKMKLFNLHKSLRAKLEAAKDPQTIAEIAGEMSRVEADFDVMTKALDIAGTEAGRALNARKMTINEDFDLLTVLTRAKGAKGRELDAKESAEIEELVKKLEQSDAKVREMQQQIDDTLVKKAIAKSRERKPKTVTVEQIKKDAHDIATQIAELLKAGCTSN